MLVNDIPQPHSLEQHSHENPQFDILTCNNPMQPLHIEQPSSTINVHNTWKYFDNIGNFFISSWWIFSTIIG